jgi:hypothetical protein
VNLLSKTITVLRYAGAVLLFLLVSLALGLAAIIVMLGFYDIAGVEALLILAAVSAAAGYLGVVLLPRSSRRARQAAVCDRIKPSAESGEDLIPEHVRDELNERLEAQLAYPARLPPHEFQVRPSIPPAELHRDGDHG